MGVHTMTTSLGVGEHGKSWLGVDNVANYRKMSKPLAQGVAPTANSAMFKSPSCFEQPEAKSWEHRFTLESTSRAPATLKGLADMQKSESLISLGTGRPSSEYFPFDQLQLRVPRPPYFQECQCATDDLSSTVENYGMPDQTQLKLSRPPCFQESHCETHSLVSTSGKYDIRNGESAYDLSVAMNYGYGSGSVQLLRFITEHVEIVHRPLYSNWGCCLTAGSTSALEIVFRMFCKRGDFILAEEFSYSGALEAAKPLGLKTVGIKMDDDGLLQTDLDAVLTNWDASVRGSSKPFVFYTIPTGQNPTGATQTISRRREIYAVAEKHDLLIIEDDPYYFLQLDPYSSSNGSSTNSATFQPEPTDSFLDHLLPSLLSLDVSGRVIRLDSTSKLLAPGLRCGWLTAPSQIINAFVRHSDGSTCHPSGVSQLVMYKLLDESWGHKGFFEWLMFLRFDYTRRRDIALRACEDYLPKDICTWKSTNAGMFHWILVEWRNHPDLNANDSHESQKDLASVESSLFTASVNSGVLYCKGSWFRAEQGTGNKMFLRTTFASTSAEKIIEGIKRLGQAIHQEFRV